MGEPRKYSDPNLAIITRCQNGEKKAFQELYSLYAKAMFNISFRIVNNTEEAEEVLQDAFLKAFERIGTYDPKYAFGAWLKRMVINASLDVLKKRKAVLVPLDNLQIAEEEDEEQEIEYDVVAITHCITQLPDGFRTILSLYVFEGHTHKEIAEMLGISEGTSKSQYNRAKKKLMELIKHNAPAQKPG